MRQRWIKMAAPTFLVVVGLTFFVRDEIHLHTALNKLAMNHAGFVQAIDVLTRRNEDLVNEASKSRQQAEDAQRRSSRLPSPESLKVKAPEVRAMQFDMFDFESEKQATRPVTIISALPGGDETMRRNFEDIGRYDQAAVTDFLKLFGGRVNGVVRKLRGCGLDTSRLQRHIETINSLQGVRLVANDLSDLADQLEASPGKRPRRAPEVRIAPDVRSISTTGQE